MKRIVSIVMVIALSLGLVGLSASPAFADINSAKCSALSGINEACNGSSSSGSELSTTITHIINIMSVLVGVVAVIMIIYAGFRYVTSGGDSSGVTGAKNTLIYAIVGLIVVALAQTIVLFVLGKVQ